MVTPTQPDTSIGHGQDETGLEDKSLYVSIAFLLAAKTQLNKS